MTLKLCLHFFCAHWALWISNWAGDISPNLTDPLGSSSLHTITAVKGAPTSCLYVNQPRDLQRSREAGMHTLASSGPQLLAGLYTSRTVWPHSSKTGMAI